MCTVFTVKKITPNNVDLSLKAAVVILTGVLQSLLRNILHDVRLEIAHHKSPLYK